ncbi:hypothetical protein ACWEHT_18915 [Streptomyces sp. NPDC004646]
MITVQYALSDNSAILHDQKRINLAKADLLELCYSCFGGDLTLNVDGLDLSIITGGGVQVLDFAVEFFSAGRAISSGERCRISFAGMSDEIYLAPDGNHVEITCNYADGLSRILREDFVSAGRDFLSRVLADITSRYPELEGNSDIKKVRSWVGITS